MFCLDRRCQPRPGNRVSARASMLGALVRWISAALRKRWSCSLGFYALLEAWAYLRFKEGCIRLAAFRTPMSLEFPRAEWRRFFFRRLCSEARARPEDLRIFVEKIFYGRPIEQLTRAGVEAWLRMYLSNYEDADRPPRWSREASVSTSLADAANETSTHSEIQCEADVVKAEAVYLRGVLEGAFGCNFQESYSNEQFIRINSPVTNHTPSSPVCLMLPIQIAKSGGRFFFQCVLSCRGFARYYDQGVGMEYWFRDGKGPGLLFVHGLGFGLVPYAALIWNLASCYSGPLLLCNLPSISGNRPREVGTPFPRAEELAESIEKIKALLGIHTLYGSGHSLGGMVLSSILKYKPSLFDRIAFIEAPVFFFRATDGWPMIFKEHSVISLCTQLAQGSFKQVASDLVLSDLWQQHVIHHGIWFWEFCHLEKNLDQNTLVILGERDDIAVLKTREWLAAEHPTVQVRTYKGDHGGIIFPRAAAWLATTLTEFCAQPLTL